MTKKKEILFEKFEIEEVLDRLKEIGLILKYIEVHNLKIREIINSKKPSNIKKRKL